jgi:peptidoglycan/LPS O-acetylase OafA/YrhL
MSQAIQRTAIQPMSKATSFFLDLLRVTAALVVFVGHCSQYWFHDQFPLMARLRHGAVVVFFVLSGYVIAYSTLSKAQNVKTYTVARLSRLYSVVVPALLLTFILQMIGTAIGPALYTQLGRGFDAVRFILALGFLQNIWHLSASPPTNGPFWSLSYEFWYYVLFGVAVFSNSVARKVILLVIVALVAGPNILLLLPTWMLGVVLYLLQGKILVGRRVAMVGAAFSLCAMVCSIVLMKPFPYEWGYRPLLFSGAFISDWVTAIFVFLTILFFDRAFSSMNPAPRLHSLVRFCSDHTFSLYLYHYPMIVFVTATNLVNPGSSPLVMVFFAAVILCLVLVLSSFTEAKRGAWRIFFERFWKRIATAAAA